MSSARFLGIETAKWSSPGRQLSTAMRYAVAVAAVALAVLLRLSLDHLIGAETQPYITICFASALVAWLVGFGPALVTLSLGLLTCLWVIVPPRDSLMLRGSEDIAEIMFGLLVSFVIVLLIRVFQLSLKAKRQTEQARKWLATNNLELERVVQERTLKLQETIDELQLVSHALVHDMRAPLRAMAGYATLLRNQCDPGSTRIELCERICRGAERFDKLIQDSLSYTRSLEHDLLVETVDLSTLLPSVIEFYPNLEKSRDRILIEGCLPRVLGNKSALTQCFANLLDNGLKFVAPGVQPQLKIWAENKGAWSRIWVEDNGVGVPKEYQGRIFDLFEQVNPSVGGTGVGLAVVRKTVQRMGGRTGVESTLGKGSRFWVDLRCQPADFFF